MPLLKFDSVSLAYGSKPLLLNVSFVLEAKERVCLVGRNGEGKSTFLSVAIGSSTPDDGVVWTDSAVKVGNLQQEVPTDANGDVYSVVADGLPEVSGLLKAYHELTSGDLDDQKLKELERVQHQLEAVDGWTLNSKVENIIDRLGLDQNKKMSELSGGWKRRVLLAQALVSEPDVLVLDEPTNHLDIPAIMWLEEQLLAFKGSIVFVSHDRAFIKKMSTRIIELDRGNLTSWPGNYDAYLEGKKKQLADEEKQNALFDKRLSEEEVWIRKGIKARRTRNEGRVRSLKKMREERKARLDRQGNATLRLESGEISGKLVAELKSVDFGFDGSKNIIKNFTSTIIRGDRIGFIGENGCGKTTLIKLILGDLSPVEGSVKAGTNINVAYFDQLRGALDEEKSVVDNVADGYDFIEIGSTKKHVMGYLNDFLFTADRARSPVKALSGGEKNRLLLAKLFAKPSNLLVLDEPTNDLDIETLELLEESLSNYEGTILLISHDRDFIDSICTSTFAFEGQGIVREYVGGYEDWKRQGRDFPSLRIGSAPVKEKSGKDKPSAVDNTKKTVPSKKTKLSYKLKLELEQLPEKIAQLESEQEKLNEIVNDASFYSGDQSEVQGTLQKLSAIGEQLEQAMDRWLELEDLASG